MNYIKETGKFAFNNAIQAGASAVSALYMDTAIKTIADFTSKFVPEVGQLAGHTALKLPTAAALGFGASTYFLSRGILKGINYFNAGKYIYDSSRYDESRKAEKGITLKKALNEAVDLTLTVGVAVATGAAAGFVSSSLGFGVGAGVALGATVYLATKVSNFILKWCAKGAEQVKNSEWTNWNLAYDNKKAKAKKQAEGAMKLPNNIVEADQGTEDNQINIEKGDKRILKLNDDKKDLHADCTAAKANNLYKECKKTHLENLDKAMKSLENLKGSFFAPVNRYFYNKNKAEIDKQLENVVNQILCWTKIEDN